MSSRLFTPTKAALDKYGSRFQEDTVKKEKEAKKLNNSNFKQPVIAFGKKFS